MAVSHKRAEKRGKDEAIRIGSIFNLGFLCDELSTLLKPISRRYFSDVRLVHEIGAYKNDLEKMARKSAENFERHLPLKSEPLEMRAILEEINIILVRFVSPHDRVFIEIVSGDLERELKVIRDQIAKRKSLLHYSSIVNHPRLEEELKTKILVDSMNALVRLEADKKLIVAAQKKLNRFKFLLRGKRNPNIRAAGIGLFMVFYRRRYPKTLSIKLAYDFSRAADPQHAPASLQSFHVTINQILH